MKPLIIRQATLADGTSGDLYLIDGILADAPAATAEIIDAAELLALPGLVDPHAHLREPGNEAAETIATGTLAAARGGYTCVLAMPNTTPATNGPDEALWLLDRAAAVSAQAQVVPIGAITHDRAGKRLAELSALAESAAKVRVFSDDGACVMDAALLRAALETVASFDGVIAEHAQDAGLAGAMACCGADLEACAASHLPVWPRDAEWRIVERDIALAEATGARVHICHVSTLESLDLIRRAKEHGVRVSAEATPHHLLLGSDLLIQSTARNGPDTTYKVNPPLRPTADVMALREAVADGTIDMIGTDHAPHTSVDKGKPFPAASPGMIGLEQALSVVMETLVNPGMIGWPDVARLMSHAPATLAGLDNQGQPLIPGNPANIVLIDPNRRAVVDRERSASKARNNPYHGMNLPDPVVCTIWAGQVTYRR
ncbi:MAG: dihydroorotase [Propionibacteriaceae bacterium]|jgi:dihydroorotase|nr:dihydroorotase [Propionibacteriaceae bacterium]